MTSSACTAEQVAADYGFGRKATRAERSREVVARVRAVSAPAPLTPAQRAARSRQLVAAVRARQASNQAAKDRAARRLMLNGGWFILR